MPDQMTVIERARMVAAVDSNPVTADAIDALCDLAEAAIAWREAWRRGDALSGSDSSLGQFLAAVARVAPEIDKDQKEHL